MTNLKRESDKAWIWTTRAVHRSKDSEKPAAMVCLHGGDHRPGAQERESLDAQILIPWLGRRSDKEDRLAALKRLQTLIDQEISDLSGPSERRGD
jgi:hypothetical protein